MKILHIFVISIMISGSSYPAFALDTSMCDANSLPHYGPHNPSHIYIKDTSGNLPYIPLTDHTAIFHDDDVWNTHPEPRTIQVTLTIHNQDTGQLVFNHTQSLQMQACSGPESVKWRFVPIQVANYIATISDDRDKENMIFNSILDVTKSQTVSSPLEQLRFGIDSHSIVCKQDLQLVIKSKDGSPACVKPGDVSKLVERGWADKPNSLQEQLDMVNSCIGPTDACRHSYDTKNMTKENQTGVSVTQTIPSCVSNISHQYAIAGFPGDLMCPVMNVEDSGKIQNTSGFYGIYNYAKYPGTLNFVLEPGHNGTITYLVSVDAIYNYSSMSQYANGVNIANGVEFMHDAGMNDHPRVDVLSNPSSELIQNHESALVTIVFSASNYAPSGTYWVTFPPGVCTGGQVIILTIAECTK